MMMVGLLRLMDIHLDFDQCKLLFFVLYNTLKCPGGETGRHAGLKILWPWLYGFDSRLGY